MSSLAQASLHPTEAEFLARLRSQYEAEGFIFTIAPQGALLPPFLGSYTPDALAQKPGRNIAIEVKRHQSQATQKPLQDIRRLFDGHPDWQLNVVYMGSEPHQLVTIAPAPPGAIRERMNEVRSLIDQGHRRTAFVTAWSLLEATLRAVEEGKASKPRTPGTVVQTLAMQGYIAPDLEGRMRLLIQLRNRIVHGDLVAEPSADDINLVLQAIEETLAADAE